MRLPSLLALGLLALPALCSGQEVVELQSGAVSLIEIAGDVRVQRAGQAEEDARPGMGLAVGDELFCGYASSALISFLEDSRLEVQANTQIKVLEAGGTTLHLGLDLGAVKAQVRKVGPVRPDVRILTPTATASVRGTDINLIRTNPCCGTEVQMGGVGSLFIQSMLRGVVQLGPRDLGRIPTMGGRPMAPLDVQVGRQRADVLPRGLTPGERADVRNANVPQGGARNGPGPQRARDAVQAPQTMPGTMMQSGGP